MEELNLGFNDINDEESLIYHPESEKDDHPSCRKASLGFLDAEEHARKLQEADSDLPRSNIPVEVNEAISSQEREIEETFTRVSVPTCGLSINILEKEDFRYVGEVRNELREGFGISYSKDGRIFKGTFINDKREGYGVQISPNGDILKGELVEDAFNGYCEFYDSEKHSWTYGQFRGNRFTDIIVTSDERTTYEGDVIRNNEDQISIGTLKRKSKNGNKVFMGEIHKYREEQGLGVFIINNASMYLCEIKNKLFENYFEIYTIDGVCTFGKVQKSLKQGLCFSYTKEGKVVFGNFIDNFKNGAFISFSNCHNLPKASVRLELYHLDFRSKCVDKMETLKKYLQTNYPEYSSILNINYADIISNFNRVVSEEMAYFQDYVSKNVEKL